jgi:hypothetical protein
MGKARVPARPVMSVDAWRAAVAADRPPLTPEQIAVLRPIAAEMMLHMGARRDAPGGRSAVSPPKAADPPG